MLDTLVETSFRGAILLALPTCGNEVTKAIKLA